MVTSSSLVQRRSRSFLSTTKRTKHGSLERGRRMKTKTFFVPSKLVNLYKKKFLKFNLKRLVGPMKHQKSHVKDKELIKIKSFSFYYIHSVQENLVFFLN